MIAAVEGRKYPIFSIGFHPEKPIFEFKVPGQHLPDSI
jgi:anthranilate/para-aminobenzoate synthase component II